MRTCVFQFSKVPHLNHVKTRMLPELDPRACVQLHCALTAHTSRTLSASEEQWDFQLWVDQQPKHEFFQQLMTQLPRIGGIYEQSGADLGERMHRAFAQVLKRYDAAIVVGSDCPFITESMIKTMISDLERGVDCALIPAHDGGYVAMGLKRLDIRLFTGIDWGSDRVFKQTLEALQKLCWSHSSLPPLADIDRPSDLQLLQKNFF